MPLSDTATTTSSQSGRIDEIGPVVNVYRSLVNHRDYIVYFHPFIKSEINLKTAEKMRENPRTALCKVLHQKGDAGDRIIAHDQQCDYQIVRPQESPDAIILKRIRPRIFSTFPLSTEPPKCERGLIPSTIGLNLLRKAILYSWS